jgi:hypothetical protein
MPAFVKNANVAMGAAPDQATRDAVMQDSRRVIDGVQSVLERCMRCVCVCVCYVCHDEY